MTESNTETTVRAIASRRWPLCVLALAVALVAPSAARAAPIADHAPRYTLFEAGQVRPLALSPDGTVLAAVNTPADRVMLFSVTEDGLEARGSVPVGDAPVAVAMRSATELWVVNHLSDSVSVVELNPAALAGEAGGVGWVVRTLHVGDEPQDIVFAGPERDKAFITTARRGQNAEAWIDPKLTTPSVGRGLVWVFDAAGDPAEMAGRPLTIIELFARDVRALAVTPDGRRVYAAAFRSGNRTTALSGPYMNAYQNLNGWWLEPEIDDIPQMPVGQIVRQNADGDWVGPDWAAHAPNPDWIPITQRAWNDGVNFNLPDHDVFTIDADRPIPAAIEGEVTAGVGTILYGMAVRPDTGAVHVTHTEALNDVPWEHNLRCNFSQSRLSVIDGEGLLIHDLNPHLPGRAPGDDRDPCVVDELDRDLSLAIPTAVAFSSDGRSMYLTAMGSDAIAMLDSDGDISDDGRLVDPDTLVRLTGGGPTGLVVDDARSRVYVATRFDNGISIVDADDRREIDHLTLPSPEPASVTEGRRLLYNARATSATGEVSCASCHVFGHTDGLAWDLSNPTAKEPLPTLIEPFIPIAFRFVLPRIYEAIFLHQRLKGPMTTQSLRGMANHGPMHWRGDRYDPRSGRRGADPFAQPDTGLADEEEAFKAFNGTFVTLQGLPEELDDDDMQAFTDFTLQLMYPPNAVRQLDNQLTPMQARGFERYFDSMNPADAIGPCNDCHTLDATANAGETMFPGFFGTDGKIVFPALPQLMKVPHLRNLYDKVCMFGSTSWGPFLNQPEPIFRDLSGEKLPPYRHLEDQVCGFGFGHDGTLDSPLRYLRTVPFNHRPIDDEERPFNHRNVTHVGIPDIGLDPTSHQNPHQQLMAFLMAFPGNHAPIVGQQISVSPDNWIEALPRVKLLVERAEAGDCELVVKTTRDGAEVGMLLRDDRTLLDDRGRRTPMDRVIDMCLAEGDVMTFTCKPLGEGWQAIDRDLDGMLDGIDPTPDGEG